MHTYPHSTPHFQQPGHGAPTMGCTTECRIEPDFLRGVDVSELPMDAVEYDYFAAHQPALSGEPSAPL